MIIKISNEKFDDDVYSKFYGYKGENYWNRNVMNIKNKQYEIWWWVCSKFYGHKRRIIKNRNVMNIKISIMKFDDGVLSKLYGYSRSISDKHMRWWSKKERKKWILNSQII